MSKLTDGNFYLKHFRLKQVMEQVWFFTVKIMELKNNNYEPCQIHLSSEESTFPAIIEIHN